MAGKPTARPSDAKVSIKFDERTLQLHCCKESRKFSRRRVINVDNDESPQRDEGVEREEDDVLKARRSGRAPAHRGR